MKEKTQEITEINEEISSLKRSEKNKKKERGNHGETLLPVSNRRHPDKSKKKKKIELRT